jgi:hypothetical protein
MEDTKDQLPSSPHEYTTKNSPTTDQKNDKKLCSHTNCKTHPPTNRQTDRLTCRKSYWNPKKLMILPMHQNIRTETREAETLSPVILFSESGRRRKKERKNTAIPFSPQFRLIRLRPTSDGSMDVRDLWSGQLNKKKKTVQTKRVEDRGRSRAMKKDGHGMRGLVKCVKRTWGRGRWWWWWWCRGGELRGDGSRARPLLLCFRRVCASLAELLT